MRAYETEVRYETAWATLEDAEEDYYSDGFGNVYSDADPGL